MHSRKLDAVLRAFRRRFNEKRISGFEIGKRIRIYDVICPLRYDILVRVDFIEFLGKNKQLSATDMGAILDNPSARAYESWFREVAIRRFLPEIYHDDVQVRERFIERVRGVKELWESISSIGFDVAHPIRLRSGNSIQEVNGKRVGTSVFAGDGCHRIACLVVMGKEFLEPAEYEVALSAKFQPLDNTAILIDALPITMPDYLSFISRGYCRGRALATANEALAYVEEHDPGRLGELNSVFQHDLVRIN